MNKTHILVLTSGSYIGGTEIVTVDILKGLLKEGYLLSCLVNGWNDGDFIRKLKEAGISYEAAKLGWFYIYKIGWSLDSLWHLPKARAKGKKFLAQEHNLVYTTSYRYIALLYAFLDKPLILHVHEAIGNDWQFRFLRKWLDPKIDLYIAVSEYIKNNLITAGVEPQKIRVIHNGIDLKSLPKMKKHPIDLSCVTFGIVGQIIPRKGHQDVVIALNQLKREGITNFKLRIVGKGPTLYEKELKQLIEKENLSIFVDWIGYKQGLADIYENIDVLIAPTRNEEPFGMIAVEANAFGIPVLASASGGLKEIIMDGENGWTFPPGDIDGLVQLLKKIMVNPQEIALYGTRGKTNTIEMFSVSKQIKKILDTFKLIK